MDNKLLIFINSIIIVFSVSQYKHIYAQTDLIELELRYRQPNNSIYSENLTIDPRKCGIIVTDMWASHSSWAMAKRSEGLVPRMNQVFDVARELGMKIIFIPSDFSDDFIGTAPRDSARAIPDYPLPEKKNISFPSPVPSENNMEPPNTNIPYTSPYGDYPQHPDLVIEDVDYIADWQHEQELYNITKKHGITHLFYTGCATNMCVLNRPFGMENMTRYGFPCIVIRDLTEALTKYTSNYNPDDGTRYSVEHIEKYVGASIHSVQLTDYSTDHEYSNQILKENGLLSYWRMSGNSEYKMVLDLLTNQGIWRDNSKAIIGVPGITESDSDGATLFTGNTALVIGPSWWSKSVSVWSNNPTYRQCILTENSKLLDLSSGSFTVEAWVQIRNLSKIPQWILSHDDGEDNIDFLLGINQDSSFQFITRNNNNVVTSHYKITKNDIDQNNWFHLVGVQDITTTNVSLFMNGNKQDQVILSGESVNSLSTLQIGSRGNVYLESGSNGVAYICEEGFEFFNGVIDELAIYNTALSEQKIKSHYEQNITTQVYEKFKIDDDVLKMDVYPNPFNFNVQINIHGIGNNKEGKFQVFNILGQIIYEKKIRINSDGFNFNWKPESNSYTGLYFIRFKSNQMDIVKKVTYLK